MENSKFTIDCWAFFGRVDWSITTTMHRLVDRQSSCVRSFIDNIDMVNRMYNQPMTLIFNEETLYLGSA
mgnify:CR=1 FL=1